MLLEAKRRIHHAGDADPVAAPRLGEVVITGPADPYAQVTEGRLRDAYLKVMKAARSGLADTALLREWDEHAREQPRSTRAHLRTLLAVHRAEDLVALDLPWWTYRAIDQVEGFLLARGSTARAFEFGSGASTVWLARRCSSVVSVEHDGDWADRVRAMLAAAGLKNVEIIVPEVPRVSSPVVGSDAPSGRGLEFRHYVRVLRDRAEKHDLIAVDGRARETCLAEALDHAHRDTLVILDDAQRQRYQPAMVEAEAQGWAIERNRGPAPCEPLRRETALLTQVT